MSTKRTNRVESEPMEMEQDPGVTVEEQKKMNKEEVWKAYSNSLLQFAGVIEENNAYFEEYVENTRDLTFKLFYRTLFEDLQDQARALTARANSGSATLEDEKLVHYKKMSEAIDLAVEEWKQECGKITIIRKMTMQEVFPIFTNTMKKLNEIQEAYNQKL